MLKYVFPCTGHSGSRYVAALLTNAGVPCGHEKTFRLGVSRHYVDSDIYQAESSAFATPYLQSAICDSAKVVHVIRHPLRVLRSWLMGPADWGYAAREFFCQHMAQRDAWLPLGVPIDSGRLDETNPNWLAVFWLSWNRLTQAVCPCPIFHVERGPALLDMLGISRPEGGWDNRKENTHLRKADLRELTFDVVTNETVRTALVDATAAYGYPLDPKETDKW